VEKWLRWSENQRAHPAWVFGRGDGGYHLYRIPANGEDYVIADEFLACAEFIVRVVQQASPLQP